MDMSTFKITYDGPALVASQMDVRDLAPMLLAIAGLLRVATAALYGNDVKPQTSVKATFKAGSFGIEFNLATSLLAKVRDIFAGDNTTAIANSLGILGALGFIGRSALKPGLLTVLKWIKGREIDRVETTEDSAMIHIGGEELSMGLDVFVLLNDAAVRNIIGKILRPLATDGIEIFAVGTDSENAETVTTAEMEWFIAPEPILLDEVQKLAFSVVSPTFDEDRKWLLNDGFVDVHAAISDAEFLDRVNNSQIAFAKGDILMCDVRFMQKYTEFGIKTEYEVLHVREHLHSPRRMQPSDS